MRYIIIKSILLWLLLMTELPQNRLLSNNKNWFSFSIPNEINIGTNVKQEINWISIQNGHFVTKNDNKRIRFFGTTVGWNYPNASHKAIDRSVEYMRSIGINSVRIHYPGLWERDKNQFNKEKIEKFDYLTYSLSKHKIYYVLYSLNMLYLNYKGGNGYSFKATRPATLMDSTYINGIKIFWDSLMNHRNIYTGIKYKNDSALAFIILTNENSVDKLLRMKGGMKLLRKYWNLYKGHYGFSNIKFPNSENSKTYKYLLQFAAKADSSYFVNMKKFLRGIGVKVPMTFTNNPYSYYTQKILSKIVDFICVHNYANYASGYRDKVFKSNSPLVFDNNIPGEFPTRSLSVNYYNKPVIVDEWNMGYPSIYRIEPTILIPFLCGEYDYDGEFFFLLFANKDYLESPHNKQRYFMTSLEAPYSIQTLFFPSISYAFFNGYISKKVDSLIVSVDDNDAKINNIYQFRYNPLILRNSLLYYLNRIVVKFTDRSNLDSLKVKAPVDRVIRDKKLYWDYKNGIFSISFPRYFAYAGKVKGKFLFNGYKICSKNNRLYVTLVPLDNRDIEFSNKILIAVIENGIHEGDSKIINKYFLNKQLAFYPSKARQMSIERIPAILSLRSVNLCMNLPHIEIAKMAIYALYPNGKSVLISHISYKDNNMEFTIDTGKYKTCYYLLK